MRPRPIDHLDAVSREYPGVWAHYDTLLSGRGADLPDWPNWCFCPLAAAYAVVSGGGDSRVPIRESHAIARVGALAAWRPTQGIYRFDATLLQNLWETPVEGVLPTDHLKRLPEWCVYVETPDRGKFFGDSGVVGFFAHLEWDANTGKDELRFLVDTLNTGLVGATLPLGGTLEDALSEIANKVALPPHDTVDVERRMSAAKVMFTPLISVLLYLCAEDSELRGTRGRGRIEPKLKMGKRGLKMPAAPALEVWETGFDLGRRLREAEAQSHQGGTVRGHVRRAHWHSYRVGPRESSRLEVRWLSPILVGLGPDRATRRDVE